jgi:hypothetical protein
MATVHNRRQPGINLFIKERTMTPNSIIRATLAFAGTVAVAAAATALVGASTPKFFDDDPIWVERPTQDASSMKPTEINLFVDLTRNLFSGRPVHSGVRAGNVNSVDEVPDSTWFTNRIGSQPLTAADIERGPDTTSGPAAGAWTISSSKSDGVTPGFTVTDVKGQRWFLKFDPPGYRGMATGTEVAVTKLMWALGYHVPENHIAYMQRDQLVLGSTAKFTPAGGNKRPMRTSDIDALLERANREKDGSYRVVASKSLPGKPIGRIRFSGTRPDDPNDLVPHENRRELRGYGVFAAWLNHVDAKAINTLDTLVEDEGGAYVRHNLVDFGSSLGSGGVAPADYWAGSEYLAELRQAGKQIVGFGFRYPQWHTARFYEAPAIGRFPADNHNFNPELWKPRVPNPAFVQARADDKFWAAQKLAAMTTDLIRAAVRAGQFGDPAAEEFLVRALAERRDAIVRAYLTTVNPIADPALARDGSLTFRNAAVDADFAKAPQGYRAIWASFDNATGTTRHFGETVVRTPDAQAPAALPRTVGSFVKVELSAVGAGDESWHVPVNAYFRLRDLGWQLVGFERQPAS